MTIIQIIITSYKFKYFYFTNCNLLISSIPSRNKILLVIKAQGTYTCWLIKVQGGNETGQ